MTTSPPYPNSRSPLLLASLLAMCLFNLAGTVRAADLAAKPPGTLDGKAYSEPTTEDFPKRVLWGNTHQHTSNSFDAGFHGTLLGPEDAFRFASGEEVVSTSGVPAKLHHPYDFLVVTDHSEYMGLAIALNEGEPALLADPMGKHWYDIVHTPGMGIRKLGSDLHTYWFNPAPESGWSLKGLPLGPTVIPAVGKTAWERSVAAAEKYNQPGRFTAMIGFEWSSVPGGNNLHRNVIFRDNADRALQVMPLTSIEHPDPEQLWRYLADYEQKTGGEVLAIPHNSNQSGGMMFADRTLGGKPFDRAYAEERAKWEPMVEITQSKGDSETLPVLSPEDDFANFERWDDKNILGSKVNTPQDEPFNYVRPSLTRGLKLEEKLGVNPFKFGFVGGTDMHTGLSTTEADNFFGVYPEDEPGPNRLKVLKFNFLLSSGLTGVWATENTRASIFDALKRKEAYATTGTRITVRVFAGWNFEPGDASRSDFVKNGYANGVPMGGDLSGARAGQVPALLILAAKDPDGANLDRVQVIKGWVDVQGNTHEAIYDAAWSDGRKINAAGKLPLVGSTVDVPTATYSNSIGAPVLATTWKDPKFDANERAYYYVRVIEIPTPRWTTYDAARYGEKLPEGVPAAVTQRAYTSPIWYTPNPGA